MEVYKFCTGKKHDDDDAERFMEPLCLLQLF